MALESEYETKTTTIHHCTKTNCQGISITEAELKQLYEGLGMIIDRFNDYK